MSYFIYFYSKNVMYNYTDAEVKVREATSNDPWGPSSTIMTELAEYTFHVYVMCTSCVYHVICIVFIITDCVLMIHVCIQWPMMSLFISVSLSLPLSLSVSLSFSLSLSLSLSLSHTHTHTHTLQTSL